MTTVTGTFEGEFTADTIPDIEGASLPTDGSVVLAFATPPSGVGWKGKFHKIDAYDNGSTAKSCSFQRILCQYDPDFRVSYNGTYNKVPQYVLSTTSSSTTVTLPKGWIMANGDPMRCATTPDYTVTYSNP